MNLIKALLFCATVLAARVGFADEDLAARLQSLDQSIEASQTSIRELGEKQSRLEQNLKELKEQIGKLDAQRATMEAEYAELNSRRTALVELVKQSEQRQKALEALSISRLRSLYVSSAHGPLQVLRTNAGQTVLLRNAYYYSKLRTFDSGISSELSVARQEAEEQRRSLDTLLAQQAALKLALTEQQRGLVEKQDAQGALIQKIKSERTRKEGLLTTLRAQVLRLDAVLASLTNAGESPDQKRGSGKHAKKQASKLSSFDGPGLEGLKGQLALPVQGAVLTRFGSRNGTGGGAKGIEISCDAGTRVRSVAAGKVLFVGKMPEFGTVVVLDHGLRYYSLYGRLAEVSVKVGDEASKGESIAKTADPSAGPGNLYFEIRNAGIAIDPERFFR